MKDVTGRLARASSLHPWRTLALWGGVLVLSVAAIGGLLGSALTTDAEMTNDPESYRAYDLLREHFPPTDDYVNELVVIRSKTVDFESPAFRGRVERLAADLEATGVVQPVRTYYSTGERLLVAPSRRALVVPIGLRGEGEEGIDEVIEVVDAAETDGFETAVTGEFTADRDFTTLSEEDLQKGELQFGLPAALIVLLLVFGAVVAGLVPVLVALVAIIVSLGLTALLGQAFDLSVFVVNMISGMGLALGIDYSLFVVSRYREERRLGSEKLLAIATVGSTASRAVLFSGSAFVLAMVGMVLVPDTILRSLAAGAILVGIVTVLAALTLLPAVLALIGDRVNALRVPWLGRRVEQSAGVEGRVWSRIVRSVTRTPVLAAVLSAGLLVVAALPVLRMETGLTGVRELPGRFAAKQGFTLLEEEFGIGTADSVQVVVEGDIGAARVEQAIAELARRVGADGAFLPAEVSTSPDGRLANVEALVAGDSRDERALEAVQRLRSEVVPEVFAGVDAEVLVSGETAEVVDYRELTDTWLPIVFAFVLALSFVLLTIAFRAVVLPCGRDRAQPALGRRRVRADRARLPRGRRTGPARLHGGGRHRRLAAAVPVRSALRPLDGLHGVPPEPDPGARRGRPVDGGGRRLRRRLDGADHHRRRADHHRGLRRLRRRRPGRVPADGVRGRRLAPDRRDGGAARPPPGRARHPRRADLVPAALARLAAAPRDRGRRRRAFGPSVDLGLTRGRRSPPPRRARPSRQPRRRCKRGGYWARKPVGLGATVSGLFGSPGGGSDAL